VVQFPIGNESFAGEPTFLARTFQDRPYRSNRGVILAIRGLNMPPRNFGVLSYRFVMPERKASAFRPGGGGHSIQVLMGARFLLRDLLIRFGVDLAFQCDLLSKFLP
jgi:hypothetical protein